MGGGNAQKSAMKRAKNQEKAAKAGAGSQMKQNQASLTIKCHICLQTFVCNATEKVLKDHSDNRHPTADFYACFPHLKQ